MLKYYILLIISILLGVLGQINIKLASKALNIKFDLSLIIAFIKNLNIWLAVIFYGISFLMWIMVLNKFQLSFARPMVSLGYILTAILSMIFLNEKLNIYNWIGTIFIVIGVLMMSLKGIKLDKENINGKSKSSSSRNCSKNSIG